MSTNLTDLPADLPVPEDDGGAAHLVGQPLPEISLPATTGEPIDLRALTAPRTVIFIYPMTGQPGVALPDGWDAIPGARGCTPQTCAFRDFHRDFAALDTAVMGLSANAPDYQREMVERLHVPFPVLSDERGALQAALNLPTFEAAGQTLLKRMTLFIRGGAIEHVHYPVFPPNESADHALTWLRAHPFLEVSRGA